ncbi:hypothetical protein GIY23_11915 [Allosaccharopolyspora coralli]|uniref:Thiamine-binding protein domain-containing protein n=1 Tax=Allosaccharopolyspora coralli TaxID=2665642 RepID=A0A5Q3Q6B1_9PSEU|nr:hypothetical protein [Allosaccharopolyspora coralli]QGK70138.1 hypothetical protein GIY23_11915 [Allosaccharopolyspora coralli]
MILRAEFTTEPFETEGEPPSHALAARDCLEKTGLRADFGPLGTSTTGEQATVVSALSSVIDTALAHGAHQITLQVTVEGATAGDEA